MAKKKIIMEPIPTKTSKWTATFKKRKASLFKKASQLSELCGVDTCVVVYEGPADPKPDTWPPREEVMPILSRFLHVPEAERAKKMLNGDGILLQQVQKMQLQLQKINHGNRELEAAVLLNDVLSGQSAINGVATMGNMIDLSEVVQKRLSEVKRRISELALVSVSEPRHHMTPEGSTSSAALSPGLCVKAVKDNFGFFCPPPPPPIMNSGNWTQTGGLQDVSFGLGSALVPIPDWCKEGEMFNILESTSPDMAASLPLPNLCVVGDEKEKEKKDDERCGPSNDNASLTVVGAEMEDDTAQFLESLIQRCQSEEDTDRFWDGSMEKFDDEEMGTFFNGLNHNSNFETDEMIGRLLDDSYF